MHGAGGPFARRVLVEELGFPEVNACTNREVFMCLPLIPPLTHLLNAAFTISTALLLVISDEVRSKARFWQVSP